MTRRRRFVKPFRRAVSRPMRNRSASAGDTAEQLSQTVKLAKRVRALQTEDAPPKFEPASRARGR